VAGLSLDDRCSLRSLAADEPLSGTASTIRRWLLLEHQGPWGRDLLGARLPDGLGRSLLALERRTGARVLLIRRTDRSTAHADGRVTCVAVDTRDAWHGSRVLARIEDAAELDPGRRTLFSDVEVAPLFVICTHGRRDPCCAERGRPLADVAASIAPEVTWESTHVGGDRFAGNVVAFPHGLYFGRVRPSELADLFRAYADGSIEPLARYRGRSSHPIDVQTAEIALRARLGLDRIGDVVPIERSRARGRASVTFTTPSGGWTVALERVVGEPMRLTCHSEREEVRWTWRAVEIGPAT
jgi:hypothetical protein